MIQLMYLVSALYTSNFYVCLPGPWMAMVDKDNGGILSKGDTVEVSG